MSDLSEAMAEGESMADDEEAAAVRRSGWRIWLRRLSIAAAVVVILPFVLTPLYIFVRPVSTLMVGDLLSFQGYSRQWVDLDDIAPSMRQAVVMSEDGQFCFHDGVDWEQLRSVLSRDGGPNRGASTITMQTVKNVFLWPSRSYIRKGLEIPLALYADLVWSKRRTLEIYLNIAELGPNVYGVEAAAQYYYKKSASKLSRREAALIAAALPNPAIRNPLKPSRAQKTLARIIERRVSQSGAYVECLKS
ncbi:monofunctional biosynthetic peptidoglycan transglycosylase [Pleomorphomonas sp. NRK KF1]|uniref:monofunctional biosynthetic peptidoglycan transglycosylase n=1 Tax=Pleomorphomonas sp. NRK KF1 TaxID=2943000 RepID=UPI002043786B|nr:monofunctional biosynthetic peptidoglycan transglycosylase [Pleomorphomonas sp. NRK KF1]MCM5554400.1 monofunctional biosynthetic peptidoglycan transglycosylase [Pleomorphomonas sp. NRK KF1]